MSETIAGNKTHLYIVPVARSHLALAVVMREVVLKD